MFQNDAVLLKGHYMVLFCRYAHHRGKNFSSAAVVSLVVSISICKPVVQRRRVKPSIKVALNFVTDALTSSLVVSKWIEEV